MRTELNRTAQRRMAVLRPLRVGDHQLADRRRRQAGRRARRDRQQPGERRRRHALGAVLAASCSSSTTTSWPSRRRSTSGCRPASEVRLRGAFFVTCTDFDVDADGNVTTVYVTYDPDTRGGNAPDGRKVKSTMHWVSAAHARRRHGRAVRAAVLRRGAGRATGDAVRRPRPRLARAARPAARSSRRSADTAAGRGRAVRAARLLRRTTRDEPMLFHRTVGLRDEWANIQKRST